MKKLLYFTLFINLFLYSCTKEEYVVELPMSDVFLSEPSDKQMIDLNNTAVDKYHFVWDKTCEGGNTIVLSASPVLLDPVKINVGEVKSYDLNVLDADQYFSLLGVESGKNGTIYWSVKPTNALTVAASEIRSLEVKRISSKLIAPVDQFKKVLDIATPSESVSFSWDTDGMPQNASYSIRFGTDPELSGTVVNIPVGAVKSASVTQEKLQSVIEELSMKKYETSKIYWNIVNNADNSKLSRSSNLLLLDGMMIFKDVRGSETIIYKVVKLTIGSKTQIWLAENLRATKYPDGTNIESSNIKWAPASMGDDYVKAYGAYYHDAIKKRIVPKGWKLPSAADLEALYGEAASVPGQWNVLKDPVYYAVFFNQNHINEWGLSLVSAGQWSGDGIVNQKQKYCYLSASDTEDYKCVLHDGGATLWYTWTTGAPVRIYYVGE